LRQADRARTTRRAHSPLAMLESRCDRGSTGARDSGYRAHVDAPAVGLTGSPWPAWLRVGPLPSPVLDTVWSDGPIGVVGGRSLPVRAPSEAADISWPLGAARSSASGAVAGGGSSGSCEVADESDRRMVRGVGIAGLLGQIPSGINPDEEPDSAHRHARPWPNSVAVAGKHLSSTSMAVAAAATPPLRSPMAANAASAATPHHSTVAGDAAMVCARLSRALSHEPSARPTRAEFDLL
jgi:hypothetical protein